MLPLKEWVTMNLKNMCKISYCYKQCLISDHFTSIIRFDPKTLTFRGTAFFKGMSLVSNYDVDGKVLLAPITGKGTVKMQLGKH